MNIYAQNFIRLAIIYVRDAVKESTGKRNVRIEGHQVWRELTEIRETKAPRGKIRAVISFEALVITNG